MYGFALLLVNKEAGSRRGSGRIILELDTKLRKLPRLVKAIYGELVMVAHLRDSMDDNSKEENIEEHDPVLTLSKFQVMRVYATQLGMRQGSGKPVFKKVNTLWEDRAPSKSFPTSLSHQNESQHSFTEQCIDIVKHLL